MARSPASDVFNQGFVSQVETWLDARIPVNAREFNILTEVIEKANGKLNDAEWKELEDRYLKAGWKRVEHNHWTGQENGNGPYFRLSL